MGRPRKSRKFATTLEPVELTKPRAPAPAPTTVIVRQYAPDAASDLTLRLQRLYADWLDVGYNIPGATIRADDSSAGADHGQRGSDHPRLDD